MTDSKAISESPVAPWAIYEGPMPMFRGASSSRDSAVATIWHELFHRGLHKLTISEAGASVMSKLYNFECLEEAVIEPAVGSKGDSDDNALDEFINGLYKAELIQ